MRRRIGVDQRGRRLGRRPQPTRPSAADEKTVPEPDFAKPHVPLLFIAGEKDHIIPKELNKKNFEAYQDPNSVRTYKEFKNRGHFICGDKNWEEVAHYICNWLN